MTGYFFAVALKLFERRDEVAPSLPTQASEHSGGGPPPSCGRGPRINSGA